MMFKNGFFWAKHMVANAYILSSPGFFLCVHLPNVRVRMYCREIDGRDLAESDVIGPRVEIHPGWIELLLVITTRPIETLEARLHHMVAIDRLHEG